MNPTQLALATLLVTGALCLLTLVYAAAAWAQVTEARRQRVKGRDPLVCIVLVNKDNVPVWRLHNAGLTPALSMDLTVSFVKHEGDPPTADRRTLGLCLPAGGHLDVHAPPIDDVAAGDVYATAILPYSHVVLGGHVWTADRRKIRVNSGVAVPAAKQMYAFGFTKGTELGQALVAEAARAAVRPYFPLADRHSWAAVRRWIRRRRRT